MTIDLIRQARERLEALKAESTQGDWRGVTIFSGLPFAPKVDGYEIRANGEVVAEGLGLANFELIEVLHRTIDVQIQILMNAEAWADLEGEFYEDAFTNEIALAKAIMGVE